MYEIFENIEIAIDTFSKEADEFIEKYKKEE
jgi:hypothetical protein